MRSGGSVNTYTARIITELLKDGQVSNLVKEIRVENKAKMEALLMILADELPKECQILHKPTGGYFVYIKLPNNLISTNVIAVLRNQHDLLVLDVQGFLKNFNILITTTVRSFKFVCDGTDGIPAAATDTEVVNGGASYAAVVGSE
uniref:Uncharacterized protein n=1 Tax=Panagrolaimus davidi TaxID=227884 RepID=A0A914PBN8_9BILA